MRQRKTAESASSGGEGETGCAQTRENGARAWKAPIQVVKGKDGRVYNWVVSFAAALVPFALFWETLAGSAYGRFGTEAVFKLDAKLGWWLLELPVSLTFVYFFFVRGGSQSRNLVPRLLAAIVCLHYTYRGWIFPYLIKAHKESNFSATVAFLGPVMTVTHGYLTAKWLAEHGKHLTTKWLRDPRFITGVMLYFSGFAMIVWHDHILRELRQPGGPRYSIPHGGLFEYVTCAQYTAELWAFTGFALLMWGPNGLFILGISLANLVPRAVQTTIWYKEVFGDDYPQDRYHILPFIF